MAADSIAAAAAAITTRAELIGNELHLVTGLRILRVLVELATNLVVIGVGDLFHRRGIRAKPVRDDVSR